MGGENGWNNGWSMLVGSGLDVEKLEVAAISLGIARAALDDAWSYANERRQFGKPIAEFQSIQHKLAQMKTQIQAAKLMVYNAAWLADQNRPCGVESSMAKLFATETCKYAALECQTILGAYGYVKDFDSERYVRDALLMPIIGGSSAIQLNNIFKASNKTG
jgi:alkylation response protein AidB-like acyl-CoA dehydrogenase